MTEIAHIQVNLVLLGVESHDKSVKNVYWDFYLACFLLTTFLFLNISLGVCAACRLIDFTMQSLVEQILEDFVLN